jgi:predicted nuclease with TOPRIM domain
LRGFFILDGNMTKQEIAEALRKEVGELEVSIKKVQARCERLKRFVLDLEEELNPTPGDAPKSILDGKFREVIDKVFGEKPKRPKQPKQPKQ